MSCGHPIVLDSCSGRVYAFYEGNRNPKRVSFTGGGNGAHSIYCLGPDTAERIVTHFEGYCRNNGETPAFHRWCRKLVASDLAMVLRNLADQRHGRVA
jgi:hypothetical protein